MRRLGLAAGRAAGKQATRRAAARFARYLYHAKRAAANLPVWRIPPPVGRRWRAVAEVYETHPVGAFRKLSIVYEFLKLPRPCNSLLAPGAGQLLGVRGKERMLERPAPLVFRWDSSREIPEAVYDGVSGAAGTA